MTSFREVHKISCNCIYFLEHIHAVLMVGRYVAVFWSAVYEAYVVIQ